MSENEFFVGEKTLNFNKVIITGFWKSGKTVLGRILGTLKNVEYMDEPWLGSVLPAMQDRNLVNPHVAKMIFRAYVEEFFNDIMLLRQANFRPRDQSSIWDRKEAEEVYNRLINLHSRDDVKKYIKKNRNILLLNLPMTTPYISFFTQTFTGCKIINIVRSGLDVASDLHERNWFANSFLKRPICNGLLFTRYHSKLHSGKYYLPWLVEKGDEDKFLKMSGYGKGLYLWRRHIESSEKEIKKFNTERPKQYMEVRFENLLENPGEVVNSLSDFMNAKHSNRTANAISEIDDRILKNKKRYPLKGVPKDEINKVNKILAKLNYPNCNLP